MLLETIWQDLRFGVRNLSRNRGFTSVSVLALALGVGINTGTFTAYKALVTRPLDARDPGQMANIALTLKSGEFAFMFSYPDYVGYRDQARSFRGVIAWSNDLLALTEAGGIVSQRSALAGSLFGKLGLLPPGASNAEFASTFIVSENYFSVLGRMPLRGRSFESTSPSVLISENYWKKRFAGDPAVLGKTVRLNGVAVNIVGITPHDFVGTSVVVPDFWLPLSLEPLVHPDANEIRDRENFRLRLFGRLAPGVGMREAQAEMTVIANRLRSLHDPHSEWSRPVRAVVSPGSPLPGKINTALKFTIVLIMVAAGLVLVIACANVASLQLARAKARQNELNMRLSLGASRGRLIRQLLTESAVLGVVAGLVALPCTWAMVQLGATLFRQAFPMEIGTVVLTVTPDFQIFGYALAVSLIAGLLFGIAPALESSHSALFSTIRGGSSRRARLRNVLVASQVAVSLVLMIAGSMLVHSSLRAVGMATGYEGKHVVDLDFRFPEGTKYNPERKLAVINELRGKVARLPGVVEITSGHAPDGNGGRTARVSANGASQGVLHYSWVQANYFRTLGIPLLVGAGFPQQNESAEHSVLLSESAARSLWPGRNPLGRTLRLSTDDDLFHPKTELLPEGPTWQVIGVVRDTRGIEADGSDSAQVYLPLPQERVSDYPILIRTRLNPEVIIRSLDSAAASVDPDLVISTATLEEMLRQTPPFLGAVFSAAIAITIGMFGLLLAAMGIYGTVSYIAVLRTREVGIRMAIGAQKTDILGLMIRESMRSVVAGLLFGMLLAIGASRLLRGVLFGVGTVDAISFLGTSALFVSIALLATYFPSRRAMAVDPLVALRYE